METYVEILTTQLLAPSEELGLMDADIAMRGTVAVRFGHRAIGRTIYVRGTLRKNGVRQFVRCVKHFNDPMAVSLCVVYRIPVNTEHSCMR